MVEILTDIDALDFFLPWLQVNMPRLPTTQKMMAVSMLYYLFKVTDQDSRWSLVPRVFWSYDRYEYDCTTSLLICRSFDTLWFMLLSWDAILLTCSSILLFFSLFG
jgi:hypothetical protein